MVYDSGPAAPVPLPALPTRSLYGLGIALRLLLLADLLVALLVLALAIRLDDLVDRAVEDPRSVSFSELNGLDQLSSAADVGWFLCYVSTGIVWLVWLYRARDNVESWSPQFQRSGQAATIYSWFIPLVNLFWPARIMRDILEDTERDPAQSWSERRGQPLVTVWAVGFAAMVLSGWWVRIRSDDVGIDDLSELSTATLVDTVITVVAVVPAWLLVSRLTEAQQRRVELERYAASRGLPA